MGVMGILTAIIFTCWTQAGFARDFFTESGYEEYTQTLVDFFFKKLVPKMSDLSTNFFIEHGPHSVTYFAMTDACSSHPATGKERVTEVFRVEIYQRQTKLGIFEEITYFACRKPDFLMREVLQTLGRDQEFMDRKKILSLNRNFESKKGLERLEYSLFTMGETGLPSFQIRYKIGGNTEFVGSDGRVFLRNEFVLDNTKKAQLISLQYPILIKYGGSAVQMDSSDQEFRIEFWQDSNPWYFQNGSRTSLSLFQNGIEANVEKIMDSKALGWLAKNILSEFPTTQTVRGGTVSLFQSEFLRTLNRVQSGDSSTVKDFLERMNRAINSGKLTVQDNGF